MKIYPVILTVLAVAFITNPAQAFKQNNGKGKGKGKSMPPGLQKKAANGKPLPPGWQKKLSTGDVLSDSLYSRGKVMVPLGKDGSISINIEGTLIKFDDKTRKIIKILTNL